MRCSVTNCHISPTEGARVDLPDIGAPVLCSVYIFIAEESDALIAARLAASGCCDIVIFRARRPFEGGLV